MLLAAVARPRHDPERDINVDGEIGIWPILEFLPAVRSSRNRPVGSLVPTLMNLDAAIYRKYVITRVIPAIKLKFPTATSALYPSMTMQHPMVALPTLTLRGVSTDGWTFVVRCQPPNSPDLNVLDLGSFASVQTLQLKLVSRSLGEVIHATYAAFEICGGDALANVLLTLQTVMRLVLENNGGNHYRLPHLGKDALRRARALMSNVSCPASFLGKWPFRFLTNNT
ncbi:hypothetical protein H310_04333 [Aphanomyces invadans]|uniref:Uncharacterized protein n=1 Tax=Aphanomyces invadans TaxID=157072 RepID=A0A024UCF5_9STRA|nr:hypothetical protein H310_04333 [Aphanomyces invadans]ETW03914.1 hypothetical protein H310_04333 [Aphanomyces invadans]|eukprot:XP_008866870.1 hypothetical protein H310_04333 [Aphanomyces invadans]